MHDPATYHAMSVPRTPDEVNASMAEFLKEVEAARAKHLLTDVHVLVLTPVAYPEGEGRAFTSAHYGAVAEGEAMCARGLGAAQEGRREFINSLVAGKARDRRPRS